MRCPARAALLALVLAAAGVRAAELCVTDYRHVALGAVVQRHQIDGEGPMRLRWLDVAFDYALGDGSVRNLAVSLGDVPLPLARADMHSFRCLATAQPGGGSEFELSVGADPHFQHEADLLWLTWAYGNSSGAADCAAFLTRTDLHAAPQPRFFAVLAQAHVERAEAYWFAPDDVWQYTHFAPNTPTPCAALRAA